MAETEISPDPSVRLCGECQGVLPAEAPGTPEQPSPEYTEARAMHITIMGFCSCKPVIVPWMPPGPEDLPYLTRATARLYDSLRELGMDVDAEVPEGGQDDDTLPPG